MGRTTINPEEDLAQRCGLSQPKDRPAESELGEVNKAQPQGSYGSYPDGKLWDAFWTVGQEIISRQIRQAYRGISWGDVAILIVTFLLVMQFGNGGMTSMSERKAATGTADRSFAVMARGDAAKVEWVAENYAVIDDPSDRKAEIVDMRMCGYRSRVDYPSERGHRTCVNVKNDALE
jgi:hypothetical protein